MTAASSTIAYLDCFSGISGDMFLGALIANGVPLKALQEGIDSLGLGPITVAGTKTSDHGISAVKVTVSTKEQHPHRTWADIRHILERSALPPLVTEKALAIFRVLAEAEGAVHGVSAEKVHFHEVGAADAIADIVGAAIGIDYLGIKKVVCSPLPMPSGWVACAHGRLPLPAPAVCEIVKDMPVYGVDLEAELVTPTGAAIIKALGTGYGHMPAMRVTLAGYGAGSRQLANGQPNLLRMIIGTAHTVNEAQRVEVVETHLDDWNPEGFPHLCETLFDKGALDVALTPILMKKGRPGFLLRVVADQAQGLAIKQCILSETSALGLRFRLEERWTLPRRQGTVETVFGPIRVKLAETPTGSRMTPEYESCRETARKKQIPLQEIYAEVGRQPLSAFTVEDR